MKNSRPSALLLCILLHYFAFSMCFGAEGDILTIKTSHSGQDISYQFIEDNEGYYLIDSKEKLIALSQTPNPETDWKQNYRLTCAINFTEEMIDFANGSPLWTFMTMNDWNGNGLSDDINGFSAIGTNENPFTGCFDGNGFSINNLYIYNSGEGATLYGGGLFGRVENGSNTCEIKNLTLKNVSVVSSNPSCGALISCAIPNVPEGLTIANCHVSGKVYGQSFTGGLIGKTKNTIIKNCSTSCTITFLSNGASCNSIGGFIGNAVENMIIKNCQATGKVKGDNNNNNKKASKIGGLIGYLSGTGNRISNSFASGDFTGSSRCGGLIGELSSTGNKVLGCYAKGSISTNNGNERGGLIGYAKGSATILNCYATGSVNGYQYTGGLIGRTDSSDIQVLCCYATGDATATANYVGGLIGRSNSPAIGCYTSGNATSSTSGYVGGIIGLGNENSAVKICYALGANITGTSSYVNRICGYIDSGAQLQNNWASGSITINNQPTSSSDSNEIQGGSFNIESNQTITALTHQTNGIITVLNSGSIANYSNHWTPENWATSTDSANSFIVRQISSTGRTMKHPVLRHELEPSLKSGILHSGLKAYKGGETALITLSNLLGTNAKFTSEFANYGSNGVLITSIPDSLSVGNWYLENGTPLAKNMILALDDTIYFSASETATGGLDRSLALQPVFTITGSDVKYLSSNTAQVAVCIHSVASGISTKDISHQGGNVTIILSNQSLYNAVSWKLSISPTDNGMSITSGADLSALAASTTTTASVTVTENTTANKRNYTLAVLDDKGKTIKSFTVTQQAGSASLTSVVNNTEIAAAGATVSVTVSNTGNIPGRWKLTEDSSVNGFEITAGGTYANLAATETTTGTITVSQNTSTSKRSYTFNVVNGEGVKVNTYTLTQAAATSNSNTGNNNDDTEDSEVKITSIGSNDPSTGKTVKVQQGNTSTVILAAADIKSFSSTDQGVTTKTGIATNTTEVTLDATRPTGAALSYDTASNDDLEVMLASLQDNGSLLTITSESPATDSNGNEIATGILSLDPSVITPSTTNPVSLPLSNSTAMSITSMPDRINPNSGSVGVVTLSPGDRVSVKTSIIKSSSTNQISVINLSMFLTQSDATSTTTSFIDNPVFDTTPMTMVYPLAALNFSSGDNVRQLTLTSDNGSAYPLYLKGTNNINEQTNGYYEISGLNIIITVWHFSSVSVLGKSTVAESASAAACAVQNNGNIYGILPLLLTFAILAIGAQNKKRSR